MLCVAMNKYFGDPRNRNERNNHNPLDCPPSLVENQNQQRNDIERKLSEGSETSASLMFGDFAQQQTHSNRASSFSDSRTAQSPLQQSNQDANTVNLQEQLLVSQLASQIMNQRSMMMNYNLPNSNHQFLGANLEESAQGMLLGFNQARLALPNSSTSSNSSSQAAFQPAAYTRVPCQARGMSTDHNALTAYLEIEKDAVHGLHLLCSHPTCRSVGVKFRYCSYCKKPVTKQNFRSRHLHADLAEKEKNRTTVPQPIVPLLPTSASTPVCLPVSTSALPSSPLTLQQGSRATLLGDSESSGSPKSNLQSLIDAANANQKRPRDEPVPDTKQRMWAKLLTERPSNMMLIAEWLSKVISFAASKNPRIPSPVSLATSPLDRESRWQKLLSERPDAEDGEKVNAWLIQVLEVSAPIRYSPQGSLDSYDGLSQRLNSPSSLLVGNLQQPNLATNDDAEPTAKKRKT